MVLSYVVTGTIGDLRLPPVTTPARVDELWSDNFGVTNRYEMPLKSSV